MGIPGMGKIVCWFNNNKKRPPTHINMKSSRSPGRKEVMKNIIKYNAASGFLLQIQRLSPNLKRLFNFPRKSPTILLHTAINRLRPKNHNLLIQSASTHWENAVGCRVKPMPWRTSVRRKEPIIVHRNSASRPRLPRPFHHSHLTCSPAHPDYPTSRVSSGPSGLS